MNDEEIIAAGHSIITDLPQLLGDDAAEMQSALQDILDRVDTDQPQAAEAVLDLLSSNRVTREELARRLPEQEDTIRADYPGGLPGVPGGSRAQVRTCLVCGYSFPVFEVGEPVPDCPRGHGPLA